MRMVLLSGVLAAAIAGGAVHAQSFLAMRVMHPGRCNVTVDDRPVFCKAAMFLQLPNGRIMLTAPVAQESTIAFVGSDIERSELPNGDHHLILHTDEAVLTSGHEGGPQRRLPIYQRGTCVIDMAANERSISQLRCDTAVERSGAIHHFGLSGFGDLQDITPQ